MPEWLPLIVTIALFVITVINGVIGYFLKQHMDRVSGLEKKHEELRKDFEQFKQQQPYLFVLREDWIRYQAAIERKLEDIYKAVVRLTVTAPQGGDD